MSSKNVEWANELLRYSIRILQGKEFRANPRTILQHTLDNKRVLGDTGYWWQARTLDYWIHRFQRGDFTARRADPAGAGEGFVLRGWGDTARHHEKHHRHGLRL